MNTFYGNKYKDQCSLDLAQIDLTPPPKRAPWYAPILRAFRITVVSSIALFPNTAGAIPGSTQNPDGSWTGPNGEDLGGGNPPAPSHDARPQSHEGDPTGVLRCGCGYVVILRDGQSKAAAERACERAVPVKERCVK